MSDAAKAETDLLEIVTAGLSVALFFLFCFFGCCGEGGMDSNSEERERRGRVSVSLTKCI